MIAVKYNYRQVVDEVLYQMNLLGKIGLDATCGRGNDSLKLLNLIGDKGFLYSCDIQEEAIKSTEELLTKEGFTNYRTLKISHEDVFDKIDKKLDIIIYNLGYLPKSDKKVLTQKESTINSIKKAVRNLNKEGVIIVVSYLGHQGSYEERCAIEEFLKNLEQKDYYVEKREFFNQKNNPPIVYLVGMRNE